MRVLVDISSDVREHHTTAQYLDALSMLIERLPEKSKAGVWAFGKYVNYLTPHQLATSDWRTRAQNDIAGLKTIAQHRNITAALRKAAYDRKILSPEERHLVLISAGGIKLQEVDQNDATLSQQAIKELVPELRSAGFKVHTLALSADPSGLLFSLAKETGGMALQVDATQDLYSALLTLMQWLDAKVTLPKNDNQIHLDAQAQDVALLLLHPPGTSPEIETPQGQLLSAATPLTSRWRTGLGYSLIELPAATAGNWQIRGQYTAAHPWLLSPPSLTLTGLRESFLPGRNLDISLKLTNDALMPPIQVTAQVDNEEPLQLSEKPPGSNRFGGTLNGFTESGIHWVSVQVRNGTLERQLDHPVVVYPLLEIKVLQEQEDALDRYLIQVKPIDTDLEIQQSSLVATLVDDQGEWRVQTVAFDETGYWTFALEDRGESSEYQVKLDFKGVTRSARKIAFELKPLVIASKRQQTAVSEEKLLTPYHKPSGESKPLIIETILPEAPEETARPSPLWILLAGVSSLAGILLLAFYWLGWRRGGSSEAQGADTSKSASLAEVPTIEPAKEAVEIVPDKLEPEVEGEAVPDVELVAAEPLIQNEEDTSLENDPEPGTRMDQEQVMESELEADEEEDDLAEDFDVSFDDSDQSAHESPNSVTEAQTQTEAPSEEEAEFEIAFEAMDSAPKGDALTDDSELASAWKDMDAESNMPRDPDEEEEVEVSFNFEDEETHPGSK